MNRAGGRVSRGEPAGTQCRGFTRSGIRHWGGFEDNGSCVAAGFASFMPAVRRARLNLRGTIPPAQSRQREAACLDSMPAKRSARSLAARCRASMQIPPARADSFAPGQASGTATGRKLPARTLGDPPGFLPVKNGGVANQFCPGEPRSGEFPRRHPRAVTVERLRRVDWQGDNRARRGVIRARVKRKARRAGLSQTGDGVPVQGR